jgi:type IV secretory pathway VirB2 component (pilin)
MPNRRENQLAVAAAAALLWVFGAVWYTALSAPWLAAIGRTEQQVQRYGAAPFAVALVLCWLVCYGIANMLSFNPVHSGAHGARLGAFLGVCIFGAMSLMQILFSGENLSLFAIDGGYGIIGMALSGALIGWMKPGSSRA